MNGLNAASSSKPKRMISTIPGTLRNEHQFAHCLEGTYLLQASMWCSIIGLSPIGKSGFGSSNDKGLNRVPLLGPPTKITAFTTGCSCINKNLCCLNNEQLSRLETLHVAEDDERQERKKKR